MATLEQRLRRLETHIPVTTRRRMHELTDQELLTIVNAGRARRGLPPIDLDDEAGLIAAAQEPRPNPGANRGHP